ncbi:MAG TPA: AMP-binding protein [Acidimicrobiales bacterium]
MSELVKHHANLWEAIADRIPDSPVLQHGDRRITWSQFDDRAARLAQALLGAGIGPGDTVAIDLYNCPEYVEAFFGALKIRAVPANVNFRYGSDELLSILQNSEAKAFVYDAGLRDRVVPMVERAGEIRLWIEVGGTDDPHPIPALAYEDLVAGHDPAARVARSEDDVWLSYTGGTTGLPKGVLVRMERSITFVLWYRDMLLDEEITVDPVTFAVERAAQGRQVSGIPASPLMHSTGFVVAALPSLAAGGTVTTLLSHTFDAHELFATVERVRGEIVAIVGDAFAIPMVKALDEGHPEGRPYDTTSILAIGSAGVAWSAHNKAALLERIPQVALHDSCGATEGCAYGVNLLRAGDELTTATFKAAPGLIVLGADGEELPVGEIGTMAGPATATGYFKDPEKSAQVYFQRDGVWYAKPGDLGQVHPDGTVTLIGRGTSTINTGGEKVYPAEVEQAISALDDVEDCVVVGVPDERFGQAVAALVQVAPGVTLEADDIATAVRSVLAGYKVPRRVRFVDRVPRMPNGKIDYPASGELAQDAESVSGSGRGA